MRANILFGSLIMVVILTIAAAFIGKKNEHTAKHTEVVLRNIGHQLLLSANDASSRVLPIKQLNENTYQISFQSKVGFVSDSLINIVQRTFQKNALATDYIVNLKDCTQKETVLAFEMNGQTGNLTPCLGRALDYGCYLVEIQFVQGNKFNALWLWLLLIPLVVAAYYWKARWRKKVGEEPIPEPAGYLPVGKFQFFPGSNLLKMEDKAIPLTEKEAKALEIFVQNLNQVVERESLMKEIWENEGTVVISRNVDVLVSKLRKKLSEDDALKILNIPGRGYKLVLE